MLPTGKHKAEALAIVHRILHYIGDRPFDIELEFQLNRRFGLFSGTYETLAKLLRAGLEEGWVAYTPTGAGYNRGQIAEPTRETAGMEIESAVLQNHRGQYHCHTRGEIDMVIPLEGDGKFCGHGAGWVVYPPGSEHFPTVTGGKALMLFFLPNGEIEYKESPASGERNTRL